MCADVPAQGEPLTAVANRIGGTALQLDITDPDAPGELVGHLDARHGGVDIVVHNAGITRDRTLARMAEEAWDTVLDINLSSQERINHALLDGDALRAGGRIVSVSSVGGIAGNRGQTNYAASKAGIIGMVTGLAPVVRERQATVNAVAPGFIETQMTAAMPFAAREAGRRMNSLGQGGQPVDVAETIAWFGSPGSAGVNGNVVRVCGQALLGA
jgi:3-oxoacyl-[acyl-carrier protein] reductase